MSQKRFTLLISLIICQIVFLDVFVFGESETKVEVPGKPLNVSIGDVNDSTIALSWSEPENPNGLIKGYRIYFMRKNFTDVQTVRNGEKFQKFVLTDLEPYMEYKLWLKAFTWKHEGEPSEPIVVQTDVRGPSAPRIANLTCHNADTLFLQWHRPSIYNKSIDLYYIYYRREDAWDFEELAVATTTDRLDHMMFLPNLTTNVMYEVKIRGATRSLFSPSKIYPGLFSESRKIFVALDCDRLSLSHVQSGSEIYSQEIELSAGMVAAMVCASFALLLVILAFVLWRKYFQAAYYYLDDGPPTTPPLNQPAWDGGEPPTHNNMTIIVDDDSDFAESKNKEFGVNAKGPIPVPLFPQHVATLHADGDIGFSKEYEAIQSVSFQGELNSEHSMNEDNKNKNRYLNIVAYDHSRVQLRPLPGQKKSTDYINANYIDGFQQCRGYIGTQGPLPSTFDAFWRMIWEQRVAVIVMITNLVERGRRKCDMYWPKEGVETHGVIQVKLVNEDARATYTIRTFSIRHLKLKKKKSQNAERIVLQFHYTNWPDHGTPEHPLPILSFVRQSAAANPIGAGPIIVHCSAGVGRTGTYIVLDAMLKQIECKNELNIRGFLCHIRNQRNFLVQTEEQYIFIHDALLEAIQAGNTNVHSSQLTRYLQLLQSGLPASLLSDKIIGSNSTASTLDTTTTTMTMNSIGSQEDLWLLLDHQFHLVTNFLVQDFHLSSAVKNCNVHKNRNAALVSVESARVYLTPKPGVEGSDYINATWLQGYQKLKEFIVTQHPLEATVSDFWQMVWDHNSQTVVVLSDTMDDDYQVFWPLKQVDVEFENFRVRFIDEHKIQLPAVGNHPAHPDEYVTQIEVAAQSLQDDYELRVRIFYCPSWPYRGAANPDLAALFRLPKLVIDSHQQYQNGPVVVVDRFGGTEAATLCALTTLMQQLSRDQHVDVYMYAKLYHSKRPNVWPSRDDYMFLYRCVEALHHHLPVPPSTPPTLHTSFSLPLQLNGYAGGGIGDTVSLTSLPPLCTTPSATSPNGDVVCFRIPPDGMEQEMVDVV